MDLSILYICGLKCVELLIDKIQSYNSIFHLQIHSLYIAFGYFYDQLTKNEYVKRNPCLNGSKYTLLEDEEFWKDIFIIDI